MPKKPIPVVLLSTTLTSCTYPIAGTWRGVELTNTEGEFSLPYAYDCVYYEYENSYGKINSFEDCSYIRYALIIDPDLSGQLITDDDSAAITLSTEDYQSIHISSSITELDCNLQGITLLCDANAGTITFAYGPH